MTTDWVLIRRAAAEIDARARGRRAVDIGLLDDGRVALRLSGRAGETASLALDVFGSPPLVTLEDAELVAGTEPAWLRPAGTALRGARLASAEARPGDRVLVLRFGAASRFGVESATLLIAELIPRFGNLVIVRDRTIVAAAKQFSPANNEVRSLQAGMTYEPPPRAEPRLDREGFEAAIAAAPGAAERVRALGAYLPEVPRLLAAAVVAQAGDAAPGPPLAGRLAHAARAVLAEATSAESATRPLHLYRDAGGAIVAAHIVELAQYADLAHERATSLLAVFADVRAARARERHGDATARRRAGLIARIAKRAAATAAELDALTARLADAGARERLRRSGDALYTHAHEIPPRASEYVPPTDPELTIDLDPELSPKENAQRYHARYRKAADAVPHLERRLEALRARSESLDVLSFEAERADAATLAEVEAQLDELEGRPPQRTATAPARKRPPLRIERPSGARIYVGRSPRENAEVTFRIAGPNDLWFHARGIPGSHVVLQPPPGGAPDEADLDAAADLAASHSRAKQAGRVEIDYTERKHVRKQRDGAPGLVWYTNARTRVGRTES